MSSQRALVTGGGGQLASDLERVLAGAGGEPRVLPRSELDVTDSAAVEAELDDLRPDVVYNCAAFHNVDVCEHEGPTAFAVNAVAVRQLAMSCAARGAKLVHLSTNYVFDGRRPEPYAEHDLPAPRSMYAISKLAGEYAAIAYAPDSLVVRSAGLYGLHGSASKGGNFITRMIQRAREQGAVRMVADQRLSPTYTADLAEALVAAVEAGAAGLVHLTSGGSCSWYEFTLAILEDAGMEVPVEPAETRTAPGSPDRPLNGVLAADRAASLGLPPLRHWRDALRDYMAEAGLRAEAVEPGSAPAVDRS